MTTLRDWNGPASLSETVGEVVGASPEWAREHLIVQAVSVPAPKAEEPESAIMGRVGAAFAAAGEHPDVLPYNAVTGTQYAGGNIMRLAIAEVEHDYSSGRGWAGYKQWLSVGRVVRKGEHGTPIAAMGSKVVDNGDGTTSVTTFPGKARRVFHFDQTTELEASEK